MIQIKQMNKSVQTIYAIIYWYIFNQIINFEADSVQQSRRIALSKQCVGLIRSFMRSLKRIITLDHESETIRIVLDNIIREHDFIHLRKRIWHANSLRLDSLRKCKQR